MDSPAATLETEQRTSAQTYTLMRVITKGKTKNTPPMILQKSVWTK
ncbi:MAG TPA: hypothetical protein IAA48_07675 [Candidatus Eubacterium faecipullorum]|uniref:Uncharacterized protein n=1 Tax=Candidatus Eubacterium faecipullorum TaxID=2838571 RepID=A0A9D1REZ3_9FIRM|nr:hypothetical protein [Candidatus Eubacterium faecipullorum]